MGGELAYSTAQRQKVGRSKEMGIEPPAADPPQRQSTLKLTIPNRAQDALAR